MSKCARFLFLPHHAFPFQSIEGSGLAFIVLYLQPQIDFSLGNVPPLTSLTHHMWLSAEAACQNWGGAGGRAWGGFLLRKSSE